MPVWLLIPIIGGVGLLGYKYFQQQAATKAQQDFEAQQAQLALTVPEIKSKNQKWAEAGASAASLFGGLLSAFSSTAPKAEATPTRTGKTTADAAAEWDAGLTAAGWGRTDNTNTMKK